MSAVAIPCPECGSELHARIVWEEGQQIPICPDCGADVSVGDADRLQAAIRDLLNQASDPITVDPRQSQQRFALVPWYLIAGLRTALGPVDPDAVDDRRYVWIDPGRRSGTPCIGGTRVPVDMLAEYVWSGDAPESVAKDYDLTSAQVLVACWYTGTYGSRTWKRRWGKWAREAHGYLWSRKTQDHCPMPPTQQGEGDADGR